MSELLEHFNRNAGAYAVALGGLMLVLLAWLIAVQLQQLRSLQDWEEERHAMERVK